MTVKLNDNAKLAGEVTEIPYVRLGPTDTMEVVNGPFRVFSKREICWNIRARKNGYHHLVIQVNNQDVAKELAIGAGFMRVSTKRPAWQWSDALLHPAEEPLRPSSMIQSIDIDYPKRSSWTSGSDSWLIFWFLGSMVSAVCFRRFLNVDV